MYVDLARRESRLHVYCRVGAASADVAAGGGDDGDTCIELNGDNTMTVTTHGRAVCMEFDGIFSVEHSSHDVFASVSLWAVVVGRDAAAAAYDDVDAYGNAGV